MDGMLTLIGVEFDMDDEMRWFGDGYSLLFNGVD
jgi:hypothetical protein